MGDRIEWVNDDVFRHTASANDKSFDVDLVPKANALSLIRASGVVAYHYRIHPKMTGKPVVSK